MMEGLYEVNNPNVSIFTITINSMNRRVFIFRSKQIIKVKLLICLIMLKT